MKRFLRLTSLFLFLVACVIGNAKAETLNSAITSQSITMTGSGSSANMLFDGASLDTTKVYQLNYVVAFADEWTPNDEAYGLTMPDIMKVSTLSGESKVFIKKEEGIEQVIGNLSNTDGKITVIFSLGGEETPLNEVHIRIGEVSLIPPTGYNRDSIRLQFPYGSDQSDNFTVMLTGKPQLTGVSMEDVDVTFNGERHTVAPRTEGDAVGCTIQYAREDGEFTLNEAPSYINAGTYDVKAKASKEGYSDTIFSSTITIRRKAATIKADSISVHQGEAPRPLTYSISDTILNHAITGIQISREEGETAGIYNISISVGDEGENANYSINTVGSTYTITPHKFDTTITIITEPTCTTEGYHKQKYTCSICNHEEYSGLIIDSMIPHLWGRDTTIVQEATCTEKGAETIKCQRCETIKTDSIEAMGHDFEPNLTIDVEASCSQEGSQSRHCTRCDAKTDIEVIDKKPHTWGKDTTRITEPSCIAQGADSITCRFCEAFKIDPVAALGHDFEEAFTIDVQPKCEEEGSESQHCTRCDEKRNVRPIEAIGHEFSDEYTIDEEANCTESGIKTRHCLHEGCTARIDTVEIEPNGGHVWEVYETIKEATCTEKGEVNRRCTKCGSIAEHVIIKELGHKHEETFTVDIQPTCKTAGEESRHCVRCDDRIEIRPVPATGHIWNDGDTTLAPTCTTIGTIVYNCIKGDTTKTDTVDALGHNFSDFIIDKPATCTEEGEKSKHCQRIGCDVRTEITTIDSIGHNWSDTTIVTQPTCVIEGEKNIKCTNTGCQMEKTEIVEALGHLFSDLFTTDIEPTCEKEGSESKHCLRDHCTATTETRVLAAKGHDMKLDTIQLAPTCTQEGQAKYICTRCDKIETRKIDALGHAFADTFTIDREPTCKSEGVKSRHCTHEGCLEKEDITPLPKGTHKLVESVVVKKATCTENGMAKFKCEVCGTEVDSIIDKLGHHWENTYTIDVEPTCTKGGSKSKHCTRCDAKTGTTVIPSPGHLESPVRWENVVEATCTENGSHDESFYCERCGIQLRSTHKIDVAKGHDYEGTEEYFIKPTCTESGIVLYTCKICKNIAKDTVNAMGHLFAEEYTVDVPATCLELGSESRHCTRTGCDAKFGKREISPLGHTWNESDTIEAPTCTKDGLISKVCDRCQAKENKIIEALGHAFADTFTVDVQPTCHSEGSKSRHCIRCEEKKDTETMPVVDHQPGEPIKENHQPATCLEPGTYTEVIVCKFCGLELSRKQGVAEDPTGHQWNEGVDVVAPTCTEGGIKTFTCTVCGFVETKNVEALGHAYADTFTIDKAMTCLTDGLQSKHCIRCDARTFETVIPATGHDTADAITMNEIAATCTTAGSYDEVKKCKICKEILNKNHVTVDALGHQWNNGITTVEPTCTGKGVISHTCRICNVTETKEISELGHQYADTLVIDEKATCTSNGSMSRHCARCDAKTDITTIPFKGHIKGDPVKENLIEATCTTGGSYEDVIYCTTCHSEISRSKKTTEAKGHTWNEGETTTAATCTTPGVATFTCTVCPETKKETIAALGHTFADTLTVDVPVGCTTDGISSKHCIRCDVKKDTVITPAHGHEFDKGVVTRAATDTTEGVKTYSCKFCDTKNEVALKKIVSLVPLANGQFFEVNAEGYCQGEDGQIGYTLKGGIPIDFKLTFSDSAKAQGFADMSWTAAPADHQIVVQIPNGCAQGIYDADVVFRNEDTVETKPIRVSIDVNLSQDNIVAIYKDVVSVVNDGTGRYKTFQWYHNGEKVEGATRPYYQEQGGLSGTYYAVINEGTDNSLRTCAKSDWYNPLNKYPEISVMPNPIRNGNEVNIKLHNFTETEHTLSVDNEFGTTIYTSTFEGDELTIPAEKFGIVVSGLFIIDIDGVKVKVLKQ